jgi:hypothetical protein
MSEQDQKVERQDAREGMEDLEVRGDEAREIAGGKKRAEGRAQKKSGSARSDAVDMFKKAR